MKSLPKRVQSPFSTVWEISRSLGQFLGDRPVSSAILALGVAALALWLIPMWQAAIVGLQGQAGLELENQLRKTLAQILAGAFVLAGLYLGWRRVVVAQEGQFTERFTRAVDQVGSEKLEIRLGGIYALERLAKDSPDKDHWTIMEVLTAFVREQSSRSQVSGQPSNDLKVSSHKKNSRPLEQDRPTDIQAAITVLGRRTRYFQYGEDKRLDLFQANLRKMDFSQGHWEGVNFARAHLEGAILTEAHLEGAILTEARLEGGDPWRGPLGGGESERGPLGGGVPYRGPLGGGDPERGLLGRGRPSPSPLGGGDPEGGPLGGGNPQRGPFGACDSYRSAPGAGRLEGGPLGRGNP